MDYLSRFESKFLAYARSQLKTTIARAAFNYALNRRKKYSTETPEATLTRVCKKAGLPGGERTKQKFDKWFDNQQARGPQDQRERGWRRERYRQGYKSTYWRPVKLPLPIIYLDMYDWHKLPCCRKQSVTDDELRNDICRELWRHLRTHIEGDENSDNLSYYHFLFHLALKQYIRPPAGIVGRKGILRLIFDMNCVGFTSDWHNPNNSSGFSLYHEMHSQFQRTTESPQAELLNRFYHDKQHLSSTTKLFLLWLQMKMGPVNFRAF